MTEPNQNTVEGFLELMRICEYRARCYVQGSRFHDKLKSVQPIAGEWSVHFRSHPRVREAEAEGWSRDLRAAVVAECKRRLIKGLAPGEPDELMPRDAGWWKAARENAARYQAGAEWQRENMPEHTAPLTAPRSRVDRAAWNTRHTQRRKRPLLGMQTAAILTEVSKRMTGEAASGE